MVTQLEATVIERDLRIWIIDDLKSTEQCSQLAVLGWLTDISETLTEKILNVFTKRMSDHIWSTVYKRRHHT